jgi:hopanoid biosynthesis associated radical SAM protein HpnH
MRQFILALGPIERVSGRAALQQKPYGGISSGDDPATDDGRARKSGRSVFMGVPIHQALKVGGYVLRQHLSGRKRYPLVLMLEPLFRCNLACAGCGKIDYPSEILNQRLSVAECLEAVDECGAPVVVIAGGEPLLHKELDQVVQGIIARRKFVIVCTNALLLEKKLHLFKPNKYFTWSVHLDGDREDHDRSVCQPGVYDKAVAAIAKVKAAGFRCVINTTLFSNAEPERVARFFDDAMAMGIDGISLSPGYAYERAPDQQHFLNRRRTKELFREIFARALPGKAKWSFNQSTLFLDFLAGNRTYECTPWGNPCRTYFGWQRPCYLLGEGYTKTFKELMETTDWDKYGTGNYEKCADCMVHCGYEATAVAESVSRPWALLKVGLRGLRTTGPMSKDIPLDKQRPAEYVYTRHVADAMAKIAHRKPTPEDAEVEPAE